MAGFMLPKKSEGVNYDGIAQPLVDAMKPIADYFMKKGLRAVCTSAKDSKHSQHSAHYDGKALDLRSWGIKAPGPFCAGLQGVLKTVSKDYYFYVVWESDHVHVEVAKVGEAPNIIGYRPGKFYYTESAAA